MNKSRDRAGNEVCLRFNRAYGCRDINCKFLHICSLCFNPEHNASFHKIQKKHETGTTAATFALQYRNDRRSSFYRSKAYDDTEIEYSGRPPLNPNADEFRTAQSEGRGRYSKHNNMAFHNEESEKDFFDMYVKTRRGEGSSNNPNPQNKGEKDPEKVSSEEIQYEYVEDREEKDNESEFNPNRRGPPGPDDPDDGGDGGGGGDPRNPRGGGRYARRDDEGYNRRYPDRSSAMKYILDHKNWAKFKGEYSETGEDAFDFLVQFQENLNEYKVIFPEENTGITEGTVIQLALNRAIIEKAGQWLRNQNGKAREQDMNITFATFREFSSCFADKYLPEQFTSLMKLKLHRIRQSKFESIREFMDEFDHKLTELNLIGALPNNDMLWDILVKNMNEGYLNKLQDKYVHEHRIYDYLSLRNAMEAEIENESVKNLVKLKHRENNTQRFFRRSTNGYNGRSRGYGNERVNNAIMEKATSDESSSSDSDTEGASDYESIDAKKEETKSLCAIIDSCLCHLRVSDNSKSKGTAKAVASALNSLEGKSDIFKKECYHCNKPGHFVRDCPELGGSGKSEIGGRFGTARGFKESDDISQRPKHFRDAVKKRLDKRGENLQRRIRSSRGGGNRQTHALQLKRGNVHNPQQTQYNIHLSDTVEISEDMSETLTSIENAFAGEIDVMYNKMAEKNKILASIKLNEVDEIVGDDENSCDDE